MSRTLNVVRMQLINRQTYLWMPLIILGGALVLSLLVFALIPTDEIKIAGGAPFAPLWYFMVIGVQALTFTFPFSQAMSVTRREFFFGTVLTAGLTALILAAIFVAGGYVEQWTHGWGLNGFFFYFEWIWQAGPLAAMLFYFTVAMVFFVTGFWAATIYKRFGGVWLTIVLTGVGLLLVAAIWLAGRFEAWGRMLATIWQLSALDVAAWGIGLVAVLAGIAFLTLRRAVP